MSNLSNPITKSQPTHHFLTTARIRLSAIGHNVRALRQILGDECDILAIVKADAYGHGMIPVTQTLQQVGIQRFGVATIQEGIILREQGIHASIVVMGAILPFQISDLIHHRLTPVISDETILSGLMEHLAPHEKPYPIHLKIDTGMRRLGLASDRVLSLLDTFPFGSALTLEGLMTHLADADNPNPEFSQTQLTQFRTLVTQLRSAGYVAPLLHAANSAGILCHPDSHFNLVRPGLCLYGYAPQGHPGSSVNLQPAMSISTKIVHIHAVSSGDPISYNGTYRTTRQSRIGVLPVGYAHGYNRRLSNRGWVLVGQHRAPIVGKICMDMTLVDLTDLPSVTIGDEVVLLGKQGSEEISANDLAEWMDTIPYEVLCAMGPRLHRVYEPLS